MTNQGWISIHRKIQQNPLYFSEPFTRIMAWVDLILITNHQSATIYVRGNKIDIKRGQFAWGEDALSTRWKWSRGKVRRYLKYLENEGQIVQQKSYILSLYTVLNYESYQNNSTTDSTTDGQQIIQQTDINNKDNKDNKDNKPIYIPVKKEAQKDIDIHQKLIDFFNKKTGRTYKLTSGRVKKINERLKTFTPREIAQAIEKMLNEPFYKGENARKWEADPDFILRNDEQIDKFLGKTKQLQVERLSDLIQ